jgi:N-acetylneuraminate synthase
MSGRTVTIGQQEVGPGHPCFVIAEIGQAHDGSLGTAHAYIDAVADTGVSAVKFQTHIASEESTLAEPWRVRFSRQDDTRYDYWARMEFPGPAWHDLAAHARDRGLEFLSSPFSSAAVQLLERVGMPAWKVASGEIANLPLLREMAATGAPVLLSSGMATWDDLDLAVKTVTAEGAPVALFQTTTSYPCPPERLGLNVLGELRRRYECPVGLSDHSAGIYAGLAAATLGADLLEVHVVFSRDCFGPDTSSSLVPGQLSELVDGIRFVETALANPVDKDEATAGLEELRRMFGKSVVARRDLEAATDLAPEHLALKKPGFGIPAARFDEVLGRTLRRPLATDEMVSEDDLA